MGLFDSAKASLGNLADQGKKAASNVTGFIQGQVIPGLKNVMNGLLSISEAPADGNMIVIGKPYLFNENVDPYGRLSKYIRAKMSVIDLIPCEYEIAFYKMKKAATEGGNPAAGGPFKISYEKKIKEFNDICRLHGLGQKTTYYGIRLYTTDGTTATDSFNIQYKDNFFQSKVDSLTEKVRSMTEIIRSVTANSAALADKANKGVAGGIKAGAEKFGASKDLQNTIEQMMLSLGDIVLKGNRLVFPKIWQNSTYNNALSAQIRLISPYGHPKAIKQFIIKPLMFLLFLASPQTSDGLSYGNCIPLTIKAYGMNYTVLGSINSITLRRGGEDTSFNVYRQPLVVDVSIDFQTLFEGFAVFKPPAEEEKDKYTPDYYVFGEGRLEDPTSGVIDQSVLQEINHPLMTMSKFLTSLQPINIGVTEGDFQVYGNFLKPDKPDMPKSGIIGGGGGGVVSAATNPSELDPFSYALKSAKDTSEQLGFNVKNLSSVGDVIKSKFRNNFKF